VNTDQAFDFLKDAGVTEDSSIQIVRRWLRERKINYEGGGNRKSGYILENTDQAINLLKEAGVNETVGMQIVRRWLQEGKIEKVGKGSWITGILLNETNSKEMIKHQTEHEKIIRQLKLKISAQEEQMKGIEKLHHTSINMLIQQRNKLKKENFSLENEKTELQSEMKNLLKENIELRNELLKLKEELSSGNKREPDQAQTTPPHTITTDYRQKLALSKTANDKEILAGYKRLLKITHPDHGGNAAAFHYIKADFDDYRKRLK